jgi:hypothetical protein
MLNRMLNRTEPAYFALSMYIKLSELWFPICHLRAGKAAFKGRGILHLQQKLTMT